MQEREEYQASIEEQSQTPRQTRLGPQNVVKVTLRRSEAYITTF